MRSAVYGVYQQGYEYQCGCIFGSVSGACYGGGIKVYRFLAETFS